MLPSGPAPIDPRILEAMGLTQERFKEHLPQAEREAAFREFFVLMNSAINDPAVSADDRDIARKFKKVVSDVIAEREGIRLD